MPPRPTAVRDLQPAEESAPAPVAPVTPVAAAPAPALTTAPVPPKRKRSTQVLAALIAVTAVGGAGAWLLGRGKESTDDAQVECRIVSVSPRVAGQVSRVAVIDNQQKHERKL